MEWCCLFFLIAEFNRQRWASCAGTEALQALQKDKSYSGIRFISTSVSSVMTYACKSASACQWEREI